MCLFLFISPQCKSQDTNCRYFEDRTGKDFICLSDDSIAFKANKAGYYYGHYSLQDTTITIHDNMASLKNYNIQIEDTNLSDMEITISYWSRPWFIDNADTTLFLEKAFHSILYYDNGNKTKESGSDGIITFGEAEIELLGDSITFFVFVDGIPFHAEATIPVKRGTRYNMIQKKYRMVPYMATDDRVPWTKPTIYLSKSGQQIMFYYGPRYSIEFNYVGDCSSCLEELRKRYPDL